MSKRAAGFTLVELIIAVSIAAILAGIGFSTYTQYVVRSNRTVARSTLMSLASKQEVQLLQNGGYAINFTPLNGYNETTPTSFYLNQRGAVLKSSDDSTIYQISFASNPVASTTTYALQAVAQGVQARRDTACTTLIINSTGLKQVQNSGGTNITDPTALAACWEK